MSRAARLGAFIVATLGILVLGTVIIGNQQYLFSSTYQLKSQFATVAGLSAGADVEVAVSIVERTLYRSTSRARRESYGSHGSSKSTHEIIKRDSVASIETEGLLGNQYLAISFGSAGDPMCGMATRLRRTTA